MPRAGVKGEPERGANGGTGQAHPGERRDVERRSHRPLGPIPEQRQRQDTGGSSDSRRPHQVGRITAFLDDRRDPGLALRLAWATGLRFAALTLLLAGAAVLSLRGSLAAYPYTTRIVFQTITAAYVLAVIYAYFLRRPGALRRLAIAQVLLDQVTWTALVYVSGGATSGATMFYALTAVLGAVLVGLPGAAIAAVSGLSAYFGLCFAFYTHLIAPPLDQPFESYAVTGGALGSPLLLNGLGIVAVAGLAGTLAERLRRAGGALEDAERRVKQAERLAELGKIAAWLAHEIRNPLGSISGSIEILRESTALSADDKHLCAIVQREAARLNELVSDMLDLAKPRPPDPHEVDLVPVAREVVALASAATRGTDSASVVYDGVAEAKVVCDPDQMKQVLWNLVRNGLQVSPPTALVVVRVAREGADVRLDVEDGGPGVSAEALPRIFEAFYTKRAHGAGIGLAVVKRVVDDHAPFGARIAVGNLSPRGAVFRVWLRAL